MQIMGTDIPVKWLVGGAAVVAVYMAWKGPRGIAESVGRLPFDLADGLFTGAIEGAGGFVGVPETNMTQCERDLAAGNTWDASFSCPAKTFIASLFK